MLAVNEGVPNTITRVVVKASFRTHKLGHRSGFIGVSLGTVHFRAPQIQFGNPRPEMLWEIGPT
jgi:hypothetical protein